jgi:hypothetical protein
MMSHVLQAGSLRSERGETADVYPRAFGYTPFSVFDVQFIQKAVEASEKPASFFWNAGTLACRTRILSMDE